MMIETPPRAWGRPLCSIHELVVAGNTPTGVGKTKTYYAVNMLKKKHPHGRGED